MDNKSYLGYAILVSITLLLGLKLYNDHMEMTQKNTHLAESVKFALDKGIEPLAVTCAYEISKEPTPICVIYVSKTKHEEIVVPVTKK